MLVLFLFATVLSASDGRITFNVSSSGEVYEGESLMVCVTSEHIPLRVTATVRGSPALTNDPSAIGGVDYSPEEISLVFHESSQTQKLCHQIDIVQDGMDEDKEYFVLKLYKDNGNKVFGEINISILACRSGDIVLEDSSIESFSFVEYCHQQKWVTLCDREEEWTVEDATVVCKQAKQFTGEMVKNYNTEANITNLRGIVPNCSGNESHIDDCPNSAIKSKAVCNPVLVDCGTTSASSGGSSTNIAAAVSVPRVLLAVVCGIIIAVFFMWRRKCKQKAERRHEEEEDVFAHYEGCNMDELITSEKRPSLKPKPSVYPKVLELIPE